MVGGLAVLLHGVARLTADIDLVIDLTDEEAAKAIAALEAQGLQPRAPVRAAAFADAGTRAEWIRSKGMQVFNMYDPGDPLRTVDLFVDNPLPFAELWSRSVEIELQSTAVRVVCLEDLIRLKRLSGRPQDHADIAALENLHQDRDEE